VGVPGAVPGHGGGNAEPGHRDTGLGQLPGGRRRRAPVGALHPAYTTNPAATYSAEPPGFAVTVQVLADGHVEATTTLHREVTPPASVQTVRRDGFASTLFTPPMARPGAPAIVVLGGGEGGEQTPSPMRSRWPGIRPWRWATSWSPGCRSACARSRWSTSPVPSAGYAPSLRGGAARSW
jgi:hypothetical protein